MPPVLAALVAAPGILAGQVLRRGDVVLALELALLTLAVVLVASLLMTQRS